GGDVVSNNPLYFSTIVNDISCSRWSAVAGGRTLSCSQSCGTCAIGFSTTFDKPAASISWTLNNLGPGDFTGDAIRFGASIDGYDPLIYFTASYTLPAGSSINGTVTVPEVPTTTFTYTVYGSTLSVSSPYKGVTLSTRAANSAERAASIRQVFKQSTP